MASRLSLRLRQYQLSRIDGSALSRDDGHQDDMSGYATLPGTMEPADMRTYIVRALDYVGAMPAKEPKKVKPASKTKKGNTKP